MGVKGFGRLLRNSPNRRVFETLDELLNNNCYIRVLAVDANVHAYKYAISMSDVMVGFLTQCQYLLKRGIFPIYIIDNFEQYPPEKQQTQERRVRRRKNDDIHFRSGMVMDVGSVMEALGIPFLRSPCEADSLCAALCAQGIVDACLSDDLDIIVLGATNLIRKEGKNQYVIYNREQVLTYLGNPPDPDEFIFNLAVLLGCDYSPGLPGMASEPEALVIIMQQHGATISSVITGLNRRQDIRREAMLFRAIETLRHSKAAALESTSTIHENIKQILQKEAITCEAQQKVIQLIAEAPSRYPLLCKLPYSTMRTIVRMRNQLAEYLCSKSDR